MLYQNCYCGQIWGLVKYIFLSTKRAWRASLYTELKVPVDLDNTEVTRFIASQVLYVPLRYKTLKFYLFRWLINRANRHKLGLKINSGYTSDKKWTKTSYNTHVRLGTGKFNHSILQFLHFWCFRFKKKMSPVSFMLDNYSHFVDRYSFYNYGAESYL